MAQTDAPRVFAFRPSQQIRVHGLHLKNVTSADSAAVLSAAIETVIADAEVCCGKDSALAYRLAPGGYDLKQLSSRLEGKHVLRDGRSVNISTEFVSPASIVPGQIITQLRNGQAFVVNWKSHVYVLYGVAFDETIYEDGHHDFVIRQLLLFDPGRADRKPVIFDRQKDDWDQVRELLLLSAKRE